MVGGGGGGGVRCLNGGSVRCDAGGRPEREMNAAGTVRPKVRDNLANRILRSSEGDGVRSNSADRGLGNGDRGMGWSLSGTGTVLMHNMSELGPSSDRRVSDEDDFGVGRTAALRQGSDRQKDDNE